MKRARSLGSRQGGGGVHGIEELIRRHERRLRSIISRRAGAEVLSRSSVDDLFQEAATEALKSSGTFTYLDERRFERWFTTIARRVIYRNSSAAEQLSPPQRLRGANSSGAGFPEDQVRAVGKTPSSAVAGHERRAALREAIAELPDHYREVLTLYKLEQHTLLDVARRMGKTKGATAQLIARASSELRKRLESRGIGWEHFR